MKTWQKIKADLSIKERYLIKEKVLDSIRKYFKDEKFHEVQTPILVPTPSMEPNLEAFETKLVTSRGIVKRAFLIMSPEYSLKKLLAAGMGNIFEITRSFRNFEEVSSTHNPEFTILEWYRVNASYLNIMLDFEKLLIDILKNTNPNFNPKKWRYLNNYYDLTTPWPRISVSEAFQKFAKIDTDTLLDQHKLITLAKKKGYNIQKNTDWEQIFYQIFLNEIEPKLKEMKKPVFIYDYPLAQAALARKKVSDPRFAERFEIYLAGLELGNCFSELINATEQAERLKADFLSRKKMKKNLYPIDTDFIEALKSGMPEVSGIAVGVDRIVMLASDTDSIEETLFFPGRELFDLK